LNENAPLLEGEDCRF